MFSFQQRNHSSRHSISAGRQPENPETGNFRRNSQNWKNWQNSQFVIHVRLILLKEMGRKIASFREICQFPRFFFFGRRRLKKRSEKTRNARSKRKHQKGKGRGQAAEKKRSPLHLVWKRGRARSTKIHACGARISQEFQEILRECEGSPKNKGHASRSPRSSFWNFADNGRRTKKNKIGRAAAAVRDGWNRGTKIMKKDETESNTG